jgi:hypothetical protein
LVLLRQGVVTLYILDSVGAVSAAAEAEAESIGDSEVAVNPKLVGKFTRHVLNVCNRLSNSNNETAFILINQVRAKIGGRPSRTPVFHKPGGYGLLHNKHLCLQTSIVGSQYIKVGGKITGGIWAKEVAIRVDKSKVCVPHRSCLISFITSKDNPMGLPVGPNVYAEAANMATACGVFEYRSSHWWHHETLIEVCDENGELVAAKKEQLMHYLYQNPEMLKTIQEEIIKYYLSMEIHGVSMPGIASSDEVTDDTSEAELPDSSSTT